MLTTRNILLNVKRNFVDLSGKLSVESVCNEENRGKCLDKMRTVSKRMTTKLHPSTKVASVLIPIVNCDDPASEPSILYTLRSNKLRKHISQVSFPGKSHVSIKSILDIVIRTSYYLNRWHIRWNGCIIYRLCLAGNRGRNRHRTRPSDFVGPQQFGEFAKRSSDNARYRHDKRLQQWPIEGEQWRGRTCIHSITLRAMPSKASHPVSNDTAAYQQQRQQQNNVDRLVQYSCIHCWWCTHLGYYRYHHTSISIIIITRAVVR